jgi:hypothetical protein
MRYPTVGTFLEIPKKLWRRLYCFTETKTWKPLGSTLVFHRRNDPSLGTLNPSIGQPWSRPRLRDLDPDDVRITERTFRNSPGLDREAGH